MSQKLKVVTIGGGSSYTPELLEGLLNATMNYLSPNYGWLTLKTGKRSWALFMISASE